MAQDRRKSAELYDRGCRVLVSGTRPAKPAFQALTPNAERTDDPLRRPLTAVLRTRATMNAQRNL
jgi:hypothetical protein